MTERKLLVVGGHGFIGSHIVAQSLQRGFETTALSLNSTQFALKRYDFKNVTTLNADLRDVESLEAALGSQQFTHVVNCGGYIEHTLFQKGGRRLIQQHLEGVMNLVSALDRTHLQGFVQLGSSDEYGNQEAPQSESERESSISPYSFGKLAATHFLQMLHKTEDFPATVIRVFLAYGPGQNQQRFLPQIIAGCLENKTFPTSAGEQLRDFCYVEDLAQGVLDALETPAVHGECLNLASGTGVSIRTMIETVQKIIGQGFPQFGEIPYRPGENMCLYADTEKAKSLLKWNPATSLEAGLERTINYYTTEMNHGLSTAG